MPKPAKQSPIGQGLRNTRAQTTRPIIVPANPVATTSRTNTKQAKMIALLRRPRGATIEDIMRATDWQRHTVRGAMSGALKKRLGFTIVSEKVEGKRTVYRIE